MYCPGSFPFILLGKIFHSSQKRKIIPERFPTACKILFSHTNHESFEKRAICHCEEAKGRQSNPATILKTMRLLRRSAPRNDRKNGNSKLSPLQSGQTTDLHS